MQTINTILHPTDFSSSSPFALELARNYEARLILLHVVPRLPRPAGCEDAIVLRELESSQMDLRAYREEMRASLDHLPLPGLAMPVVRRLEEGDVAPTIMRVAKESGCDLIVMGTHGRTAAGRRLMGSVAEKVARHAPCSVVTVKAPLVARENAHEPTNEEIAVIL